MFTETKIKLSDLFMLGGLLLLSFISRRQVSMFIIICGTILNKLGCALFNKYNPNESEKIEKNAVTSIWGTIILIGLVLIIAILGYKPNINAEYIDREAYPVEATDYILENLDIQNIKLYNEYNFGSYLLFKGIPVFIDSRADLYAPEFNEEINVFTDYINISSMSTSNIENKFDDYGITHLIIYNNSKLKIYLDAKKDVYNEIYKDDNFCIYERLT